MVQTDVMAQDGVEKKVEVFKNKNFLYLFISSLMSAPGYYVYIMGAEWLMLSITDNRFFFGLLFISASIPRLLFLSVGGVLADRVEKKVILFLTDITRSFFVFLVLLLIVTDLIQAWHLILLAGLFGISDAFSYPTTDSLTAELLNEHELQRGNSLIQMTKQVSPILGPVLGGSLIYFIGFTGVFTVAFVMLAIASLTVWRVKIQASEQEEIKESAFADFKKGIQYIKANQLLQSIMIMGFVVNFFVAGPLSMGIPILVKDVFQENALALTILQVSLGVGAILGSIILSIRKDFKKPGRVLLTSLTIFGVLYALTGFAFHLYLNALLIFVAAICLQFINIPLVTLIQRTTDKKMIGKMMSMLMMVSTGLVPVSFLVTSILMAFQIQITQIMICGGIVTNYSLYISLPIKN
ncbi:MFS transporter [Salinibacillus xinjiangensis]|uniref:MFS transporter n=1 Tax=Salinibacillus xinjiangensis TaxID=1229268 RepID=A0A6G1X7T7_9BACI|nr:MFS transporter [Salinibacillus xinjiangensis]MRG86940.1 MFS transporter [Salinibacillus xinjiangensis]